MIEIGKKCTVLPDSMIQYEIIEVKSKTVKIKMADITVEETSYYVNLKEIEGNSFVNDVPVFNISLLNV